MNDHGAQPIPDPNAAHSIYSPSGSSMWLVCLGSLLANAEAPDDGNEDTAYGTVGHSVGERWLNDDARPSWLVGWVERIEYPDVHHDIEIDDEMLDYVSKYVEWCQELPGDHFVEGRVWAPEGLYPIRHQGGTADHFACEPGLMTVTDLKMGRGVPVFAAEKKDDPRAVLEWSPGLSDGWKLNGNPQGLLYALYAFHKYDHIYYFERIVIRICQPRLDSFDVWETTRGELLRFEEFVRYRASLAWEPNAPRTPSPKGCRFCRVRNFCTARAAYAENVVDECFDYDTSNDTFSQTLMKDVGNRIDEGFYMTSNKIPKAASLTTSQLAKLLPLRGVVEGFFADVWVEADRRAVRGEKVDGHKLVEGKMDRSFRNSAAAERTLVKAGIGQFDLYTVKFASPAQAEKAGIKAGMKRKDVLALVATLVSKVPGRPSLVSDNDPRPAYVSPADDIFEKFDDESDL